MLKFWVAVSIATWTIYLAWIPKERALVDAQAWNISQVYEPINFDPVLYSGFNLSQCSRDMINCWQYFPQTSVVCHHSVQFDSICGLMRNYCTDMNPLMGIPEYSHIKGNSYQDVYLKDVFDVDVEVCPVEFINFQWT